MSEHSIPSSEPAPDGAALRHFRDPAYQPLCANLAQVRKRIDELDEQIIALIGQRALMVKEATRFKRDRAQAAAPARQAAVFERVRALAEQQHTGFPHLPDIVEAAYRSLVHGFVQQEQQLLDQTDLIQP